MNVQMEWFTFPFEDEDLMNKVLVAAVIGLASFLILPLFILYGYLVRMLRQVIKEDRLELLPFDDIGGYFTDGLQYFVITIVYSLPLFVIMGVMFGVMFLLPLFALPFVEQAPALVGVFTTLSFLILPLFFLLIFPLSLVIGYFSQIAVARFADEGTLASALDIRAVWELGKTGFSSFIVAILLTFVVSFAVNIVIQFAAFTFVLLCLLPFLVGPLSVYMFAVQAALLGKAYRAVQAKGDAELEPLPAV